MTPNPQLPQWLQLTYDQQPQFFLAMSLQPNPSPAQLVTAHRLAAYDHNHALFP